MKAVQLAKAIRSGAYDERLTALYGADKAAAQRGRYAAAAESFAAEFGDLENAQLFSVPGRSEIIGNHTDHQHGAVVAAAIDLDIIAVAVPAIDGKLIVKSEGFPDVAVVDITKQNPDDYPDYSDKALIAGMNVGFKNRGYKTGAFKAYTTSDVLRGSGLSSSAAFEVMVGNILNHLYNDGGIDAPTIAQIAQYSENVFFGKPCGLMDQTAAAVGGFVNIDFEDPKKPVINKLDFDLTGAGYALCIVDTGGNHADLSPDYAAVPGEMRELAGRFGLEYLRPLKMETLRSKIYELRRSGISDRAILRGMHFIAENERVFSQVENIKKGDIKAFLATELESGNSSMMLLQNVYTCHNYAEQGVTIALALAAQFLESREGAWRVHGGGFAGTIQCFVRLSDVDEFVAYMDGLMGEGRTKVLHVRADGAVKL